MKNIQFTLTLYIALLLGNSSFLSAQTDAFHVEVYGSGAPVILIPGLTCEGQVWDATVDILKES